VLTAAKKGDADSQYMIGAMYENGTWFRQDFAEALRLFLLSATRGNARSEYELWVMYRPVPSGCELQNKKVLIMKSPPCAGH
jgi:TPR repeat protein